MKNKESIQKSKERGDVFAMCTGNVNFTNGLSAPKLNDVERDKFLADFNKCKSEPSEIKILPLEEPKDEE